MEIPLLGKHVTEEIILEPEKDYSFQNSSKTLKANVSGK